MITQRGIGRVPGTQLPVLADRDLLRDGRHFDADALASLLAANLGLRIEVAVACLLDQARAANNEADGRVENVPIGQVLGEGAALQLHVCQGFAGVAGQLSRRDDVGPESHQAPASEMKVKPAASAAFVAFT